MTALSVVESSRFGTLFATIYQQLWILTRPNSFVSDHIILTYSANPLIPRHPRRRRQRRPRAGLHAGGYLRYLSPISLILWDCAPHMCHLLAQVRYQLPTVSGRQQLASGSCSVNVIRTEVYLPLPQSLMGD